MEPICYIVGACPPGEIRFAPGQPAFVIAAAALARVVWGIWSYGSIHPLLTYNALFVLIFTVFGLLFLVMSSLFRQAAELRAENDLII